MIRKRHIIFFSRMLNLNCASIVTESIGMVLLLFLIRLVVHTSHCVQANEDNSLKRMLINKHRNKIFDNETSNDIQLNLNFHLFLFFYIKALSYKKFLYTFCTNGDGRVHKTFKDAAVYCDSDPTCAAFYDYAGLGNQYKSCTSPVEYMTSRVGSMLYRKAGWK